MMKDTDMTTKTRETMTFEFDDRGFRFTHGRAPRGFGGWAFEFEGLDMVWAPPMMFSEAKVWIKNYIRRIAPDGRGNVRVTVCT
jgi:hypothetical protein